MTDRTYEAWEAWKQEQPEPEEGEGLSRNTRETTGNF